MVRFITDSTGDCNHTLTTNKPKGKEALTISFYDGVSIMHFKVDGNYYSEILHKVMTDKKEIEPIVEADAD